MTPQTWPGSVTLVAQAGGWAAAQAAMITSQPSA